MKWSLAASAIILGLTIACNSSKPSSSTAPTPPAPITPAPTPITITGRGVSTNGALPLAGVEVSLGPAKVVTDNAGRFVLALSPISLAPLTLSASTIVTRVATISADRERDISVDAFSLDTFDLGFYRALARNGYEAPSSLQPIRRWTEPPMLYLRTIDEANQPIDSVTLDATAATLQNMAGFWSGGHFGFAGIERGTGTRETVPGWITVKWPNPPLGPGICGDAALGSNPGVIRLNYLGQCSCGSLKIYPTLVRHELGHAFGYYHTDNAKDVMYGGSSLPCDGQPSAREGEYARYMYSRVVGNVDPDTDPPTSVTVNSMARIVVR